MQEGCTKKMTTFEGHCSLQCPPLCILLYSILLYSIPATQLVQYKLDPQKLAGSLWLISSKNRKSHIKFCSIKLLIYINCLKRYFNICKKSHMTQALSVKSPYTNHHHNTQKKGGRGRVGKREERSATII